ncbi:hypothetical protein [Acaryochloris sp. IP29b_bin.137]|uniref:hypothetical protein n=1 Tax=Acaryochloris sp. IP29b_bin.137 TaxID=2969217 RepID=UPI00260A52FA|nr:hypothetical protein [Acaryochloris sp. IP29b_bin.137]
MRNIYNLKNSYIDSQEQLGSFNEWDEVARPVGAKALPANHGKSANLAHWLHVEKIRGRLQQQGWKNIRVDQQQVQGKQSERVVGINRPDISAIHPKTKERLNIEVDTDLRQSQKHQRQVVKNDPQATSQFILIHPKTGQVISSRIYRPNKKTGRNWLI